MAMDIGKSISKGGGAGLDLAKKALGGKKSLVTMVIIFLGSLVLLLSLIWPLAMGIIMSMVVKQLATGGFGDNVLAQNQATIASYGTAGGQLTYPANIAPTQVAACLDAWIKKTRPSSPLNGKGIAFAQAGQNNNVNPAFMISIATLESELGTTGGGPAHHNPFGWSCPPCKDFSSWEDGIAFVTSKMRSNYLNKGLTTIPKIAHVWAPVGASNDPNQTNGDWTPGVTQYFNSIISSCPNLTVPN